MAPGRGGICEGTAPLPAAEFSWGLVKGSHPKAQAGLQHVPCTGPKGNGDGLLCPWGVLRGVQPSGMGLSVWGGVGSCRGAPRRPPAQRGHQQRAGGAQGVPGQPAAGSPGPEGLLWRGPGRLNGRGGGDRSRGAGCPEGPVAGGSADGHLSSFQPELCGGGRTPRPPEWELLPSVRHCGYLWARVA